MRRRGSSTRAEGAILQIRDIAVGDVIAGRNWRLVDDAQDRLVDWHIEACSEFSDGDSVVYSALAVLKTGEVRPLLLVREVGTYEWWGDTCEYVEGAWREPERGTDWGGEEYVAAPLSNDPSFMGEYSHEAQRAGFARWRNRVQLIG